MNYVKSISAVTGFEHQSSRIIVKAGIDVFVLVPPVDALIYRLTSAFVENAVGVIPTRETGIVPPPLLVTAHTSPIIFISPFIPIAYVFITPALKFCEYLIVSVTSNLDGVSRIIEEDTI